MNFLAHAYLSFNEPDIIAGNMFSDFVKGKRRFDYSEGVQKGIMLHRAIDEFTDKHPVTKSAAGFFRPHYGLYAGSFMDVVYDHFLAKDTERFSNDSLLHFSLNVYQTLDKYETVMPEKFRLMFPFMKKQNWLYNYQFKDGIYNSLRGLVHRAAYITDSQPAIAVLEDNYENFQQFYQLFFPEMEAFAKKSMDQYP